MNEADTVKVVVATLQSEGNATRLRMTTTDRVTIDFDLDDAALGLLCLTATPMLLTAKDRPEPTIFPLSVEDRA